MLVVTTIILSKGFKAWKEMVHVSEDKLKEYGMTFIFAGTEADEDSKLHTVIHFESEMHFQRFHQDKELTRRRAEAGAMVETGTFTPISDEAFTNYPLALNLKL